MFHETSAATEGALSVGLNSEVTLLDLGERGWIVLDKKGFLGFAFGGAMGTGIYWLVFKKEPLWALSVVGMWLSVSAIMWLLERK